ncbi:hypothetical protein Cantr_01278 [Candida viswanathii]|uniref:Uncharacterized protein n=1 Tax=Candida viswanathii TaxID=5486 RepID=A0A367YI78_9ASCO|nr:hypothetical protein Cantr_01278 [Candida viswanathii]
MSDSFFQDLYDCSRNCAAWESSAITGPDDFKQLYCAIALNTALTVDDPVPFTEEDQQATKNPLRLHPNHEL